MLPQDLHRVYSVATDYGDHPVLALKPPTSQACALVTPRAQTVPFSKDGPGPLTGPALREHHRCSQPLKSTPQMWVKSARRVDWLGREGSILTPLAVFAWTQKHISVKCPFRPQMERVRAHVPVPPIPALPGRPASDGAARGRCPLPSRVDAENKTGWWRSLHVVKEASLDALLWPLQGPTGRVLFFF